MSPALTISALPTIQISLPSTNALPTLIRAANCPATDAPASANGKTTFRSISVNRDEFEFSEGFTDLHTRSYEEIVAGRGFALAEARPAIELVSAFRDAAVEPGGEWEHPFSAAKRRG